MKIAINMRSAHALLEMVSWVFDTHAVAGGVDENVAIQDPEVVTGTKVVGRFFLL